ncbi:MAG: anhydro-N-acetylmuramic acid kinase [bacterium]
MVYHVIGVMSGSSLDGLDIAFVELDEQGGSWKYKIIEATCFEYTAEWLNRLSNPAGLTAYDFARLHAEYGHFIGKAINQFIIQKGLEYRVGLIASHGHTAFHLPGSFSSQLGDGAAIAAETSLPVVAELRSMDVALGGQGAPIVPIGEKLLFHNNRFFLNIGGIANISFNGNIGYDAFDVCPANRVLNALSQLNGKAFDEAGAMASGGRIHEPLLDKLQSLEYYQLTFPKSLGNEFGTDVILPLIMSYDISAEDKLATYTEHVAMQIGNAIGTVISKRAINNTDEKLLITGGGAFNTYLISRIEAQLKPYSIDIEIPDQDTIMYKEALIMALIGVLRWREEENIMRSVTGASRGSISGALWLGGQ